VQTILQRQTSNNQAISNTQQRSGTETAWYWGVLQGDSRMMKRSIPKIWQEPVQRWLFIGTLLFATMAVPTIAMTTRVMVQQPSDISAVVGGSPPAEAATPSLETPGGGGSNCTPSLFGSDSVLIKHCPLKR
jgi:hypothetical protein